MLEASWNTSDLVDFPFLALPRTVKTDKPLVTWEDEVIKLSTVPKFVFGIILAFITVLALIGNAMTLYVNLKRDNRKRLLLRTCLISLSVSDVIFLVITASTYAAQFLEGYPQSWIYGELPCTLFPFFQTMAVLTNSITLTVIALDRYMAVIRIVKGIWEPKQAFCNTCAVLIWGLACGVSSPMIGMYIYLKMYLIPRPENPDEVQGVSVTKFPYIFICAHVQAENGIVLAALFLFIFLPLLIAFLWLNSVIAREVWNRRHPIEQRFQKNLKKQEIEDTHGSSQDTISTNDSKASKSNKTSKSTDTSVNSTANISPTILMRKRRQVRMFKVIVIIMVVFFICRTPQWIFTLIKLNIRSATELYWILHYTLGLLSMLNCVLNPLLYTFLNETLKITEQLSIFCDNTRQLCANLCCRCEGAGNSEHNPNEENGGVYMGN